MQSGQSGQTGESETILVVDDNPRNLVSMQQVLQSLQDDTLAVATVESGAEALDYALNHNIVLFLLDVQMPEMDGFELAELLRQNQRHRDVPILFITAVYKSDEFARRGFEVGAYDYITKPITDNQLLRNKVEIFLQLYRQQCALNLLNHSLEEQVRVRTNELVAAKERELEMENRRKIAEKEKEKEKEIQAREIAWLQREKLFMEGVVSAVPAALLVLRNGKISAVNSRFRQLFDFQPAPGSTIQPVLMQVGLNPEQIRQLQGESSPAEPLAVEMEILPSPHQGVRTLDIRSSGFVFVEEEEEEEEEDVVVILLSIGDITEQRRMEERQQYAAFQSGVAEMSMSVLHNIGNILMGLQHQGERLHTAADSLGEISGMMMELPQHFAQQHDGGPLPSQCNSLLKVFEQTGVDLQQLNRREWLDAAERIRHSLHHIEEIIHIQRSASEFGEGSSEFSLHRLLEDAAALLGDLLERHKVRIRQQIDTEFPHLRLPRSPLLQLLINLIKNSIEAIVVRQQKGRMRRDEVDAPGTITIIVQQHGEERLLLQVVDDGIGIAPERLPLLFQFGFTSKKQGGGIGLHAGTLFINKVGGNISAHSEGIGRGATLEVELPLRWEGEHLQRDHKEPRDGES